MSDTGWANLSNGLAIVGVIGPIGLGLTTGGEQFSRLAVLLILSSCFLLVAYLAASRISDCIVPFRRVTFIWAFFSAVSLAVVIPLALLFNGVFLGGSWRLVALGGGFTILSFAIWWSMAKAGGYET